MGNTPSLSAPGQRPPNTVDEAREVYALEQGGELWHRFRQQHVTATDIGLLLGTSPHGGPEGVIKYKFGEVRQTAAMLRGIELEPEQPSF